MDLITKAIDEIKYRIPREILKLAYLDKNFYTKSPISLDEHIRQKTIIPRVLVDANIAGGDTIIVDLNGLTPKQIDQYNYIFDIPPERTNHRTILTALSANYMTVTSAVNNYLPGFTTGLTNNTNDITSSAYRAMASRSNIPIVSNVECLVVGHNTVMIKNHLLTAAVMQLKCVVTNDERLSNISIRSAPQFSKLCELAVKSYIYNELLVKIERGYLERGQELGVIKTYVDGLSDAEENYQTYLREEWGVVATVNDRVTFEDLIRIQISPSI